MRCLIHAELLMKGAGQQIQAGSAFGLWSIESTVLGCLHPLNVRE
jgi:hypothetical protein